MTLRDTVRIFIHPSRILRNFLSGLSFFVPFLATTTFEFENFSSLRNFCPDDAPSFFEKIPCFVRIPTQHFSKI